MTVQPRVCGTCIWLSSGYQDDRGAGFCYSEGDYVEEDGHCDFWKASLRDEPLPGPPATTPFDSVKETKS